MTLPAVLCKSVIVTDSMVIPLSSTLITASISDVTLFRPAQFPAQERVQPDRLITGFVQLNSIYNGRFLAVVVFHYVFISRALDHNSLPTMGLLCCGSSPQLNNSSSIYRVLMDLLTISRKC